ncbi:TIGR00645 family protein, partial [Bacillus sp. AFS075960]
IMWQVIIHVSFLVSALVMAWVDRLTTHTHPAHFHETQTAAASRTPA